MSFRDVMDMPIRAFWSFVKNADRLKAGEDLRAMDIAMSAQSGEFAKQLREELVKAYTPPIKAPPTPVDHKAGIAKLRQILAG